MIGGQRCRALIGPAPFFFCSCSCVSFIEFFFFRCGRQAEEVEQQFFNWESPAQVHVGRATAVVTTKQLNSYGSSAESDMI